MNYRLRWLRYATAAIALISSTSAQEIPLAEPSGENCSFLVRPDDFLAREGRARREVRERLEKSGFLAARSEPVAAVPASQIPQRNFIDNYIFNRLIRMGVPSAPLSDDNEFVRRIYLDLTGRIPSPDQVIAFLSDSSPSKRDDLIETLLYSEEFTWRWTLWTGDLLQNTAASSNVNRGISGRNAFFDWIRDAVFRQKSLKDIAYEVVAGGGNTYASETGRANFAAGAITPMGPIQDTFDTMMAKSAATFLGLGYYDCILCHNGRGHLEQVSLWGSRVQRMEAWKMAAHFSRMRVNSKQVPREDPLFGSFDVLAVDSGGYDLNTNFGNRPRRTPLGTPSRLTPEYRVNGATPSNLGWRDSFAANMVADPMFSRNLANRLWKQMFTLGMVEPVDAMDPARLDPNNPPADPWKLQAAHPELLEDLARTLIQQDFQLRPFLRTLVQSSAYQLSSRYGAPWTVDQAPLFARHYPRRLEAEEIHDALVKATAIPGNYSVGGWTENAMWAMQLPEPVEPRSNGAAAAFLNTFLRGNRDQMQRSQSGSVQQQLALMNDPMVTNRLKVNVSPLLRAVSQIPSNSDSVHALHLLFLSRPASGSELAQGVALMQRATTPAARAAAVEDLAWVMVNKVDFLFSY